MSGTRWRRQAIAVALLAGAAGLPSAQAAARPWCRVMAVSPGFATDRTVACYTTRFVQGGKEVLVHVSRDGMRTWRQATSAGFAATPNTTADMLFFVGGTLFLQTTDQGLLFSDDLGETFRAADLLGGSPTGRPNLTVAPWAPPAGVPGFPAVEIAYGAASQDGAALIRPPLHQRMLGSSDVDVRFAPYTDGAGNRRWLSLAVRVPGPPTPAPGIVAVWDCDATLTCTEKRHEFTNASPYDMIAAPDFGRSGVIFVTTQDDRSPGSYGDRLWRSADGGRRFAEVGPAAALRRDIIARKLSMQVGAYVTFAGGRTVVLYLGSADDPNGSTSLPVGQIWVSGDLGATWKLVAYGRSQYQKGPRGNLPWEAGFAGPVHVVAGRWFVLGSVNDAEGPRGFCSRDGGKTWKTFCD